MSLLFFPILKIWNRQWKDYYSDTFSDVLAPYSIALEMNRHYEVKSDSSGCNVSVFAFTSEKKQHKSLRLLNLDLPNFRGQILNIVIIFFSIWLQIWLHANSQ